MSKCIVCKKSGLFLRVNIDGVCPKCINTNKKPPQIKPVKNSSDREIAVLNQAYSQYESSNDLQNCISLYEQVLLKGTQWNSFNFHLRLVNLYLKANRNDDAWAFLNKTELQFSSYPGSEYYKTKIRKEQFKILKKEKKYIHALETLIEYHFLNSKTPNGIIFDTDRFIKDAKSIAKGAGISIEQLSSLSTLLSKVMQKKHITESDLRVLFQTFIKDCNIVQ